MYGRRWYFVGGILATASRGGTLALAVGGVVLTAAQPGVRRIVYGVALMVGAIVAWQAGGSVFRERVRTMTALDEDYNLHDRMGRIEVWKRSMEHFADRPLIGVGAGNFEVAEGKWLAARGERGKWSAAHNAYIQALTDLGIVGGLLFLWLIGGTALRAARLWNSRLARAAPTSYRPELLAALCSFCVAAIYLSSAYSGRALVLDCVHHLRRQHPAGGERMRIEMVLPALPTGGMENDGRRAHAGGSCSAPRGRRNLPRGTRSHCRRAEECRRARRARPTPGLRTILRAPQLEESFKTDCTRRGSCA